MHAVSLYTCNGPNCNKSAVIELIGIKLWEWGGLLVRNARNRNNTVSSVDIKHGIAPA